MHLKKEIIQLFNNASGNFSGIPHSDWEFLIQVVNDRPDAFEYCLSLADRVTEWFTLDDSKGDERENRTANFKQLKLEYEVKKEIEKYKVFFFKQRKILLAIPQRKRHPSFPAPNLGGFVAPQNYRTKGEVCYNLEYCEARTFLVKKALRDEEITDILFIDDDILLPLDALTILCDTNEPIIGGNYVKKRFPIESNALEISKDVIHNKEVKPIQNDIFPRKVSQMGLGTCLVSLEVFKKIPEPWFEFVFNADGTVFAGEDVRFLQKCIIAGYEPKIIPGLVPVHVDFDTGKHWGPDWLVDENGIKKEFKHKYCHLLCDPMELYEDDEI